MVITHRLILSDKDRRPLVFTEPRRSLDGDWKLFTLDDDQYIVAIVGNNRGSMMVVYTSGWLLHINYSCL